MALQDIKFANRRPHRARVTHPSFTPGTVGTNQTVSPTGAARAIRPMRTAIRYLDTAGPGSVYYV